VVSCQKGFFLLITGDGPPVTATVTRGKVTRSWRGCSSERTSSSTLIIVGSVILFFVRVNQVLVRLWARASGYVFAWFRWLVV